MKALVLAGGFPQIDLIIKLKNRGIQTLLADYYENPVAKKYADKFFRISTLDVDAIRNLSIEEKVDFLITACTDQALLTVAKVSEELGLPCYIDYETARNVTNKEFMKEMMLKNSIPSANYYIFNKFEEIKLGEIFFPLIVKPVDCNSSKGVRLVSNVEELENAFYAALDLSRSKKVILEEYIKGKELSVDVFVENSKALVLDITTSEKINVKDKFVIFRTWHPANISKNEKDKINLIVQKIADVFGIVNAPMLIQMLSDGENVSVIEFSARTGGGVKHLSILRRTGVDIISTLIDLTLGNTPHLELTSPKTKFMLDEYIYCNPGAFDSIYGFDDLKNKGIILDYYVFKWKGAVFDLIENSGDRIGGFTIQGDSLEELQFKHNMVNDSVKVLSDNGIDIMKHELLTQIDYLNS